MHGPQRNKEHHNNLAVLCLCLLCLAAGLLAAKFLGETVWSKDEMPGVVESVVFASPAINVQVDVTLQEPTVTATPEPTAFDSRGAQAPPTPTVMYCDPNNFVEGLSCIMPKNTSTPIPTPPTCFSKEAIADKACTMRGTPAPVAASPEE